MPRRRDPRELMLLGLCLLSGLSGVAGAQPPTSVEETMPGWLVAAWYAGLVAAGTVGTVGNLWPGQLGTALLIRLSGQMLTAGPAAAYAIAALSFAGWSAMFPAGLTAVFSLVCLWTAKYLTEDVRMIRAAAARREAK